jgi:hypothetical protein
MSDPEPGPRHSLLIQGAVREWTMRYISDGWETVSCKTDRRPLFFMAMRFLLGIAEIPPLYWTVTWSVRQTGTGIIRKVTAQSEQDAREKIALGIFDEE